MDQQGKGPRLGTGQMLPSGPTAWVPPDLFLLTVCPHSQPPKKAQPLSLRLHLLLAQCPPFQVPPGLLGPAEPCPRPWWARQKVSTYHTPKKGVGPGQSGARPRQPSLPKAAGASRLGPPNRQGSVSQSRQVDFFPGGALFCNMTCGYLYKNECYNEAPWLLQCVQLPSGAGSSSRGQEGGEQDGPCPLCTLGCGHGAMGRALLWLPQVFSPKNRLLSKGNGAKRR